MHCQPVVGPPPSWELEFHLWDRYGVGRSLVLGREFEALPHHERRDAIRANADLMAEAASEIGFAAVTCPGPYWEQAPRELAYFVLPEDERFRQAEALRRVLDPQIVLVASASGVLAADYSEDFCLLMVEEP